MQSLNTPDNRAREDACSWLRRLVVWTVVVTAPALAAVPAWALKSCPVGPATISACCVADQPGATYILGSNLIQSHPKDCIDISAPKIFFSMNRFAITGSGAAGVGVHVLSTAPNASIWGWGTPDAISNFAVGFQSDAANTYAWNIQVSASGHGFVFNGPGAFADGAIVSSSTGNGIVVTAAATGFVMSQFFSKMNGANGIVVKGTAAVTLVTGAAALNAKNGIVLNGTSGTSLVDVNSGLNSGYGLWLRGSSYNAVFRGNYEGNTSAGIYVGCHPDGPSPAACAIPPSKGNTLANMVVGSGCGSPIVPQQFGIAIDKGNGRNHVWGVSTNTVCSGAGDTAYDGFDGNANCRGNVWDEDLGLITTNHTPPSSTFCIR